MVRARALLLLLVFAFTLNAAPKRRAVSKPFVDVVSPVGWLTHNAYPLRTTDLSTDTSDLAPLRTMLANAQVVGLGDGTHGTHEFFTVKLRLIDTLVRELGFDVVAFEGPFAGMNELNEYVQGGNGDPRALLHDLVATYRYLFWNNEEILAVVEWMRDYNLHRGDRPAIEIAGADVYGQAVSWKEVVAYLRTVDPPAASQAEKEYACIGDSNTTRNCLTQATRVHDTLAAREAQYIAASSAEAYHDALQYARVVMQYPTLSITRDADMARNVLWMRTHRGTSGKVIYWAHNEHVAKTRALFNDIDHPAGDVLEDTLHEQYFAIATMTAAGSYIKWEQPAFLPSTGTFPAPMEGSYETFFRQLGKPMLLIPLRGSVPAWLEGPAPYFTIALSGEPPQRPEPLTQKFDAVIFIDTTTPSRQLP